MAVKFAGEPNYQLIEEGLRRMLVTMTPEERKRHARKVGETTQNDGLEPIGEKKSPQNRI